MEHATPRVNYELLAKFTGRRVRLVCKVKRLSEKQSDVIVETSDGQEMSIQWLPSVQLADTYVEIIGTVDGGCGIRMLGGVGLGNDLDMKIVDDTIKLMHNARYKDMFYGD